MFLALFFALRHERYLTKSGADKCIRKSPASDTEAGKVKVYMQRFIIVYAPEELEVQASFGQEELVVLLKPHLAHGRVLQEIVTVWVIIFSPSAKASF